MIIFVVAWGRRLCPPTAPPEAIRSGRFFEEPPEIVIGVELPAFFPGSDFALYMLEEPQPLPAVAPSLLRRAFCEDFA
jgi:hypothetical protein